ncbi:amidase domain-containing protein [Halobacillus kuroshimensis]|uniref:amidase domain-containing protein n=1 Tax=Halobacillus kuroshimensis TaxID=302481 RepID=UPI000417CAF8|nr:amidase domain-containing protein [Halobacillus kuroshimensis]
MNSTEEIKRYWQKVLDRVFDQEEEGWLKRKIEGMEARDHKLQRMTFRIYPYHRKAYDHVVDVAYDLHLTMLVKSGRHVFLEEGFYTGRGQWTKGKWVHHEVVTEIPASGDSSLPLTFEMGEREPVDDPRFDYNRREAVRYADRWWDSYNPAYKKFEVDCTNYVSQCLRAGGAPMRGAGDRTRGWWYGNGTWSYSWTVAHALRWYLSGSRKGLKAVEVSSADQLAPGDVICYDFQGNGRYDHNTFVVKKDAQGMPLVNAHTSNSRHRYWAYEDSTAYTPDIQYKFFRING